MKHLALSIVAAGLLAGCAGSSNGSSDNRSYEYEYEVNGCKTGRHTFSSQNDYCNGLKDDERNNYCAWSFRKQAYEQSCSGSFESAILEWDETLTSDMM
ncbi:MAG TPA: hypothetical protein VFV50_19520 [Bdellovibrionales bacterium]|nr:hypothetical protein [Bdellovibrionales bacterium]